MLADRVSSLAVPEDLVSFSDGRNYLVVNPASGAWVLLDPDDMDVVRRLAAGLPLVTIDRKLVERALARLVLRGVAGLPDQHPPVLQVDAPLKVVYYAVTHGCNLGCPYCYASSGRRAPDELSTAEALDLIDQIAAMGAQTVVFTGGEALLRRDLFDLAERVRERGMSANVITNATLIRTQAIARRIAAEFSMVSVSMDGGTAESHDRTRGRGTFAKTTKALRLLKEAGVRPYVNHVVTSENLDELPELQALLAELDIAGLRIQHHSPMGRGAGDDLGFAWDDYLKLHKSTWGTPQARGLMPDGPVTGKQPGTRINCGMGGNEIGIDPRGNVTACKLLTEDVHIAGNIRQTQLSDVFTSGPLADLRSNSVLAGNNLRDCRSCYVRGGCGGGCRAFHMAHSGDLKRNSRSLCRILRHQLIASMWAAAGVDMEKFVELGDAPFHPHLVATGERHPAYGDQGPARPGDEDEGALTTSQPRSRLRMTGGKP